VTSQHQLEHACLTDVGIRRSHNQDSFTVLLAGEDRYESCGHVFQVADGMGGHAVGELASQMAVNIIPHTYQKYAPEGAAPALLRAFTEANASIYEKGQKNREFQGMGTTSTALVLRPDGAWVGHVGDSRAYRIRDGKIQQMSFDHSLLWEKARRQHVAPEELNLKANVIVRSLGPEAIVDADVQGPHPVQDGDVFLLCSDGLCGPVHDYEMGAVAAALPVAEACQFLVDLANLRGGPDNITVVIVRVKKAVAADAAGPGAPWYRRIPWPLYPLLAGVALAAGAIGLMAAQLPGGGAAFVLAALAIVGGLVGLVVYTHLEKQRQAQAKPAFRPRTKIYREGDARPDKKFIAKLGRLEATLAAHARERGWEIDWSAQQKHHQKAAELLAQGDGTGALLSVCRAIRPLSEALQRNRHKEESFQPVWETQ
jgi:protein phosphatase